MLRTGARLSLRIAGLVAGLVGVATPQPASACSRRHQTPFELFDLAERVAEVRVVTTPGPRDGGFAELRVLRTLKGGRRRMLRGSEANTSCRVGYRVGRRALVFLGPKGETLGHYDGYLEVAAADPLLVAVRAYGAATDDGGRATALVEAILSSSQLAREDAAQFLATHPELLARIDDVARARMVAAQAVEPREEPLLVVLARLGADFKAPPATSSGTYYSNMAAVLRTRDELETLDAAALAERIEQATAFFDPLAIRAMERCERLAGRMLVPSLYDYGRGTAVDWWPRLALACRTGQPLRY